MKQFRIQIRHSRIIIVILKHDPKFKSVATPFIQIGLRIAPNTILNLFLSTLFIPQLLLHIFLFIVPLLINVRKSNFTMFLGFLDLGGVNDLKFCTQYIGLKLHQIEH
jgi:hypothetical protein